MRSLLFVALALSLTTGEAPISTRDLELTVRVSNDKLVTFNPTPAPELVVLQDPATGCASSFIVPAQSRAELAIPAEISREVRLYVAARLDSTVVLSQTWSLADVEALDEVWIDAEAGVRASWIRTANGFAPVAPTAGAPSTLLTTSTIVHVPVVTPYNTPDADVPPPLESDPLPPL